jgi:hypothetical protein
MQFYKCSCYEVLTAVNERGRIPEDWLFMYLLLPLSQLRILSTVPDLQRRCTRIWTLPHYLCGNDVDLRHTRNDCSSITRAHRLRYSRNCCGLWRVTLCHDCREFLHWLNILSIRGVRWRWVDGIVLKEILGIDSPLTLLYAKVYKLEV